MDRRFLDLLPWYVNGTLDVQDRAWVEEQIRRDPAMAAELRWHEAVREAARAGAADVPPEVGIERALGRIRAERRAARAGLLDRIRQFAGSLGVTPAFAVAALVVVVQAGVIARLAMPAGDRAAIRAQPGVEVVEAPLLRIAFKPDAKEADIRMLLIDIKGEVVAGPGQLGSYYVRVPEDPALDLAKIRASGVADSVEVVPGVPPRVE